MTFKEMVFKGLCDGTVKIISNPMMIVLLVRLENFGFTLLEAKMKI